LSGLSKEVELQCECESIIFYQKEMEAAEESVNERYLSPALKGRLRGINHFLSKRRDL